MRSSNQSKTEQTTATATARDAAIQILNSQSITATAIDGVTYYSTTMRGVEYTAYRVSSGNWFVATLRLALGRSHIGGGRYYKNLDALADGCKALSGLPVFLSI